MQATRYIVRVIDKTGELFGRATEYYLSHDCEMEAARCYRNYSARPSLEVQAYCALDIGEVEVPKTEINTTKVWNEFDLP